MNKKYIMVFIVLLISVGYLLLVSPQVNADNFSPKVNLLIEYIGKNNHTSAEDILKDMSNKEKDEFINYIEANPSNISPLYYIKMADHLLKSDKDLAAKWFYVGKVRAYEDVMMCKDKTAQSQLDILQYFAPKTVKYIFSKNKDKAYMANLLQSVLDWDVAHQERVNPIWACYQGIGASTKTPELKTEEPRNKAIQNVRDELKESILKYKN